MYNLSCLPRTFGESVVFHFVNLFAFLLIGISVTGALGQTWIGNRKCAGNTALEAKLMNAVIKGSESSVRQLLQQGVDPKMQDDCGISILTYATRTSKPGIMKLLIAAGADVNAADSSIYKVPLAWAVNRIDLENRYSLSKLLIDAGANVNVGYGQSPLMEAVSKEDVRLVQLLISSGADVNLHDDDASSAYSLAAAHGNRELKQILLEAGADPTVGVAKYKKDWGEHAFLQAAADGRVDVVEAMLSNGMATVNLTNGLKVTALMRAQDEVVIDALLVAGADVNLQDNRGSTALMWAAEAGRLGIVKKLIAAGADANLRRNDGRTVIDTTGNGEIKKLLKESGANRQKSTN